MTPTSQPELGIDIESSRKFSRFTEDQEFNGAPAKILDIPESNSELGYGSHQFFRYYGKFPSLVGKLLIEQFASTDGLITDVFNGSGTTQVEAQISGRRSYGLDINPLAILSAAVKTKYYDYAALDEAFRRLMHKVDNDLRLSNVVLPVGKESWRDKWFSAQAQLELSSIRVALDTMAASPEKDFLTVAFLAIIRRCSNAFDGEVRPHVKKDKVPRSPRVAMKSKFKEMMAGLADLDGMRPSGIPAQVRLGDNRVVASYANEASSLVIAHPPYLNSFNYLQVFSLEFAWSEGMENVWEGRTLDDVRKLEQKAWPATDERVLASYYSNLRETWSASTAALESGGHLAVVVGDATIRGELEPVHRQVADQLNSLGLVPAETWFRTTHYGIGKYAYAHRADYHGAASKKDAILIFRKP